MSAWKKYCLNVTHLATRMINYSFNVEKFHENPEPIEWHFQADMQAEYAYYVQTL